MSIVSERPPQILIVEDDPNISEMLDTYFSVQGYDVVTAASGKQAVKACQDSTPDLALLDIQLPDFNGYEIAARLKAEPSTQNPPGCRTVPASTRI